MRNKYRIPLDQRTHPLGYARVRAQVVGILAQLAKNNAATIRLRFPADAELLRLSVLSDGNDLTLLGDGVTLYVTPKTDIPNLRQPQTQDTGLNAIFGKLPD